MMNDQQLKRAIRSIGAQCFVKHFVNFNDATLTNDDIIERLMVEESYVETGARTRTSSARRIIREGRSIDALLYISESSIPQKWRNEALRLTKV